MCSSCGFDTILCSSDSSAPLTPGHSIETNKAAQTTPDENNWHNEWPAGDFTSLKVNSNYRAMMSFDWHLLFPTDSTSDSWGNFIHSFPIKTGVTNTHIPQTCAAFQVKEQYPTKTCLGELIVKYIYVKSAPEQCVLNAMLALKPYRFCTAGSLCASLRERWTRGLSRGVRGADGGHRLV